jgi:ABC-type transporter Mla subunit MlaD
MEERDKKTELLVGLFLLVGLILLGTLILQFSSVRELFKGTYSLTVALPDGTGIKDGTPVMLGGSKIGKASAKPSLNDKFTGVIIPLEIYQSVKIPADAKFSIGTAGLLGDAFVEIKPSGKPAERYIEPNTFIQGTPSSGLGALQNTAEQVAKKVDVALDDVSAVVKDLRATLKRLDEGALSQDAMNNLKDTFKHINSVVTRLDEKTLGEDTSKDVKEAIASFKNAAHSVDDAMKKLDPVVTKVDGIMKKADGMVEKADKAMTTADTTLKSIDKTADSATAAIKDMRNGKGLMPALLSDPSLKEEFRQLISNLKEHGVLWYKNDYPRSSSESKKRGEDESERPRSRTRPYTGRH